MSACESPSKASATSHNMPLLVNLDYLTGSLAIIIPNAPIRHCGVAELRTT